MCIFVGDNLNICNVIIENMVSEIDYLKAKKIVDKYENQQKIEIGRFEKGDIDLLRVLSKRSRNCFEYYNEKIAKDGEEIIYISDVVREIKKDGRSYIGNGKRKGNVYYLFLMSMRNFGYKSHDEVMKYVSPFL